MPYQIEGGISGQHLIEQIVTNLFFLCSKGEDNNEIKNRIGYLKSSLEQNWRKFESMNEEKELWSDEDINETLQLHNDGHIWLHGGDIACMDKDGVFFYKQRLKRMIISSGYNVYPSQIEEVIEQHPAVLSCSVVGIPHKYKIEVAKAFIVLKEGYSASLELKQDIKELCKKNLAVYSVPKEYEFRKSLPKTLLGKIDINKLKEDSKNKS